MPFPSSGDLPDPGTEPRSPALQVDSLPAEPPGKPTVEEALALMVWALREGLNALALEEGPHAGRERG